MRSRLLRSRRLEKKMKVDIVFKIRHKDISFLSSLYIFCLVLFSVANRCSGLVLDSCSCFLIFYFGYIIYILEGDGSTFLVLYCFILNFGFPLMVSERVLNISTDLGFGVLCCVAG